MKASIIIPCHNGGVLLKECLRQCLGQNVPFDYEVVAIDSSSTDGTREHLLAVAARDPRLRVIEIAQRDFGHGKTRNLGAREARGEFLCFLTQDAIPTSPGWLGHFVRAMETFPAAAGAFGAHVAHPGHSAYTADQLERFFTGFGTGVVPYQVDSLEHYEADVPYRQRLHFFSDNNSCLRRSIWQELPYDDVAFGEDQLWADKILRRGLTKLYVADAVVRHSHEFGLRESYRRSREEGAFFARHFGYLLKRSRRSVWHSTVYLTGLEFRYVRPHQGLVAAWAGLPRSFLRHGAAMCGQYAGTKSALAAKPSR